MAEYMINEMKRKTPRHGNEILNLESVAQKTRATKNALNWFCFFYPSLCSRQSCDDGDFTCGDGSCIPGGWQCDGWLDCQDKSDESRSVCGCSYDQFTCDNGKCIPWYWQCDGILDCETHAGDNDISDERGCYGSPYTEAPSTDMPATTSVSTPAACDWSAWGEWSECNTGCGAGQRQRSRSCSCGEAGLCDGQDTEYEMCQLATCKPEADSGCGSRHPQGSAQRIVGGNDAVRGAWPWYAQLYFNGRFTCGGSLVQGRFIVTAAHCMDFSGGNNPQNWEVILGKNRENDYQGREHRSQVSAVVVHANYDSDTVDNDIAILVLSTPPELPQDPSSEVINSICPDTASNEADDTLVCFIAGFGNTHEDGSVSNILQEAEVPIVSRSTCNQRGSYNGGVTQNMLCAGFLTGGVDSCQGDSGGPLMCSRVNRDETTGVETERWYLTGITSWGNGCARRNFPGVYTKVARYEQWMENVMAANGGSGSQ